MKVTNTKLAQQLSTSQHHLGSWCVVGREMRDLVRASHCSEVPDRLSHFSEFFL